MKSKENINLAVTDEGVRFAGIYAGQLSDPNNRKRTYASLVILNSLGNFFMQNGLKISNSKNLYKIAQINEEFEITDLYVNNWRLDIRLATKDDSFYIPINHFENDILPDFYLVATIDKDFSKPQFIGYIKPENLKKTKYNKQYYKSDFEDLKDMSDLFQELKKEKNISSSAKDHNFFNSKILSYLDKEADNFTKNKLISHLVSCQACRNELINFSGFDLIASNLDKFPELLEDESLNIIGALKAQEEEEQEEIQNTKNTSSLSDKKLSPITDEKARKEKQDKLLDNLFEKSRNMALTQSKKEQTHNLSENDGLIIGDVPSLEEQEQNIEPIKLTPAETFNKKVSLTQNTDNETIETQNIQHNSIADSLKDIPDEMFNFEFDETTLARNKNNNDRQTATERVIVDYDEFGEPIYEEKKVEDYTIVEKDIQDSFKPDDSSEKAPETKEKLKQNTRRIIDYIDTTTDKVSEDLISRAAPQSSTQKSTGKIIIAGLVLLGIIFVSSTTVFIMNLLSNRDTDEESTDTLIEKVTSTDTGNENDIDNIIAKNTTANSSIIKLKEVSWVAQKKLLSDVDFKEYLQLVDRRFRVRFKIYSNNINQAPLNYNIIVEAIITPNGLIKSSRIAQSSGVESIDNAVLRSLREATSGVEIPEGTQNALHLEEYYIKLGLKL